MDVKSIKIGLPLASWMATDIALSCEVLLFRDSTCSVV
jgi:hypothetical protein